jgi:SAM-dependent methyltransferase
MTQNAAVEPIVSKVREHYAKIAEGKMSTCCGPATSCGPTDAALSTHVGYDARALTELPEGADMGLGCGAPVDFLELKAGETVLDLGSGGGIDVFLAARHVGPTGHVIGVDMTPEMIAKARRSAEKAGLTGVVEFREGRLEALPVADGTIDAVTSNCVVNLVPDKAVVFREVARVLKPGGRMVISDIVLDGRLPEALERDVAAWAGCVSGAIQRVDYLAMIEAAGLGSAEILRDVDQLGSLSKVAPEEAAEVLDGSGTKMEDILGKVRSITYRVRKPEAKSCCGPTCCS